jgi:transcriptional regulator with XRE-family HTH domain
MADRLSLGSVLKAARQARGVQQTTIAERAEVSSAALSHVEAGRNHPTIGTLKAYAEFVVGPEDTAEFLEILRGSDLLPMRRLAQMISPTDTERFLLLYNEAHRRGRARSEISTDRNFSGLTRSSLITEEQSDSIRENFEPPSGSWKSSSARSPIAASAEIEELCRSLQQYLTENGGRPIIPGGPTSDLGFGVRVDCDLIEMTKSLVFECKSLDHLEDQEIVELIGRASLLRMYEFQLVICLMSRPETPSEQRVTDMLRKAGASVIWATAEGKPENRDGSFGGDHII